MLQDIVADYQVDRVVIHRPYIILYLMKLIKKRIILSSLININSDNLGNFPF